MYLFNGCLGFIDAHKNNLFRVFYIEFYRFSAAKIYIHVSYFKRAHSLRNLISSYNDYIIKILFS